MSAAELIEPGRPEQDQQCVVTGAGIISPLGRGTAATLHSLRRGRSGIRPISLFPAQDFPIRCAGEIDDPSLRNDCSRMEALALIALNEALADAGIAADAAAPDPRRTLSFALGKCTLDLQSLAAARARRQLCDPHALLQLEPELERQRTECDAASILPRLARRAAAGGELYSCYTACASGNDAIGLGKQLIERGETDMVIAGASDSQVHPLSLIEFELLSALSHDEAERACRPFDRSRNGFVVGEGAGVLVLESACGARRRGAKVLARLSGYGSSLDGYGLTKCHPQGRGAALAIRAALADAGLEPRQVDYLNAHGTGTVLNDQAEAAAVHQVWGDDVERLPVSSTKSMTGHLLTAASAVEAVITLLCLQASLLPVNLNFRNPDPGCRLNVVAEASRSMPLEVVMSNGFGFGGQNSSLILRCPQ